MAVAQNLKKLQELVWNGSLPLEIRLSPSDCTDYDQSLPYLVHVPRLSYLPFLLPELHAFFSSSLIDPSVSPTGAWFSFETIPLKWHHPLGLLYDLFSGASPYTATVGGQSRGLPASDPSAPLPWELVLHYSDFPSEQLVQLDDEGKAVHDAFINSVKEADFLRNGTAKAIMALSKDDSTMLWEAIRNHDLALFLKVHTKLLPPPATLRHIPLRIYLPSTPAEVTPDPPPEAKDTASPGPRPKKSSPAHLKVVQALVTPLVPGSRETQTLGMALHTLIPSLFPSRRRPIVASPVLHGAVVPMSAVLDDLMRSSSYADGWVSCGIEMLA